MTEQTVAVTEKRRGEGARDRRFMAALERLVPHPSDDIDQRGDRAALAALRRALGREPHDCVEAYPAIYRALGDETLTPREEQPYFIVGPLFALYPAGGWHHEQAGSYGRHDLGTSMARLAAGGESGSIEQRFQALLDSHIDELPEHLRHAVSMLRSHETPIDWVELLADLRDWDRDDRRVQRKWARSYWSHLARVEQGGSDGTPSVVDPEKDEEGKN